MRPRIALLTLLFSTLAISPAMAVTSCSKSDTPLRQARLQRTPQLKALFKRHSMPYPPRSIFLRVLKQERMLELWARHRKGPHRLIKSYAICAASGELGPKRRSGDGQVPEGVYRIDRFNPRSQFHLSLGLNYPNSADRIHGKKGQLGGDIFIHGDCVSIGCISITDEKIEEVFLTAAAVATRWRRRIPVHIFPSRMDAEGYARLTKEHVGKANLLTLWAELRPIYEFFERRKEIPKVLIDAHGKYRLAPAR